MLRRVLQAAVGPSLVLLAACSSGTGTGIFVSDVEFDRDLDAAHARWVAADPAHYTFEYHMQTVWFPPRDYTWIEVRNGRVVAARNARTGASEPIEHLWTIEQLWDRLVTARDRGETLSQLSFNRIGVPLSAMVGTFVNDGGVHHTIREFRLLE